METETKTKDQEPLIVDGDLTSEDKRKMDFGISIVRKGIREQSFSNLGIGFHLEAINNDAMRSVPKNRPEYEEVIKELSYLGAETLGLPDRRDLSNEELEDSINKIKSGLKEQVERIQKKRLKYKFKEKAIKVVGALTFGAVGFIGGTVANQYGVPEEAIYATTAVGAIGGYLGSKINDIYGIVRGELKIGQKEECDFIMKGSLGFTFNPIINSVKNRFKGNTKNLEGSLK